MSGKTTCDARQRPLSALERARRRTQPGNFQEYFKHAKAEIRPGDRVFICGRVSEHPQQLAGNLPDMEKNLRREMARLQAVVVGGEFRKWSGFDPVWLARAAALARQAGAKWMVFESVDRAIRPHGFHPYKNPDVQVTKSDLEQVRDFTDGFPLATVVRPDASPSEIMSYQRKRGQWAKGRKGGRPKQHEPGYKKRRREAKLPRVLRLHGGGASLGEIHELTGVPRTTSSDWIRTYL